MWPFRSPPHRSEIAELRDQTIHLQTQVLMLEDKFRRKPALRDDAGRFVSPRVRVREQLEALCNAISSEQRSAAKARAQSGRAG